MPTCLPVRQARLKKRLPHPPVVALPLRSGDTIWGDTVTTYQSVGCEPKLNL